MSSQYWELVLSPEKDQRTRETLRFILNCIGQGQSMQVVSDVSLSELEHEITHLVNGLQDVRQQARKAWQHAPQEKSLSASNQQEFDPAQVWASLEACPTHKELQDKFNNLPDQARRETAQYVLSSVNMFAGAGAFFAQNYDHVTALIG
jgi:hypothetical protein